MMTAAFLRNLFLFWNGRQEGGEIVQEHDQIIGKGVACDHHVRAQELTITAVGTP